MKMKQNTIKFTENNERNLKSSWHKMPTSKNQDDLILNSVIYLKSLENQKTNNIQKEYQGIRKIRAEVKEFLNDFKE